MSMKPEYFSVKGYDFKNGTSQASPFIAGIVAVTKGVYPEIGEDEIKSRIFKSTKKFKETGNKFSSFGAGNLKESLQEKKSPVILPVFKEINSIDLLPNSKKFNFSLEVKNFWGEADDVSIILKELSGNFIISNNQIHLDSLKEGETKKIAIQGECKNLELDNGFDLRVEIRIGNILSGTYKNNFLVSRSVVGSNELTYVPINPEGVSGKIAFDKEAKVTPLIRTVSDLHFLLKYPLYYLGESVTQEGKEIGLKVEILKYLDGTFNKIDNDIFIPNGTKLLSILLLDANYDGLPDLFITSINKKEGNQAILYSYYNMDGTPLFGDHSHIKFHPESAVVNIKKLVFMPFEMEGLGKIAIPLFMEDGTLPIDERTSSSWDTPDNSRSSHLYYLIPQINEGQLLFKTKVIDHKKWEKKVKAELNLEWNDNISIMDLLPQNFEELQKGEAKALVTVGRNYFTQTYILNINLRDGGKLTSLKTDFLRMEGHISFPTVNLESDFNYYEGTTFVGQYTDTTISISHFMDEVYSSIFRQDNKRDHILGPIASFKKNDELFTFFQTKSKLKLHRFKKGEKETVSERPITRFSFLPGNLFSESFYPIIKGSKENALPALYIDATQISRNDIYILTLNENNELVSPIKYNIRVPDNCKPMNPVPFGEKRAFSFALFCLEEKSAEKNERWGLRFLKLN
jgi:cell wall-associated protease